MSATGPISGQHTHTHLLHIAHKMLKRLKVKHALSTTLTDEFLVQPIHFRTALEELDEPAKIIKVEVPAIRDVSLLSSNHHQRPRKRKKKKQHRRTVNNLNKLSTLECIFILLHSFSTSPNLNRSFSSNSLPFQYCFSHNACLISKFPSPLISSTRIAYSLRRAVSHIRNTSTEGAIRCSVLYCPSRM